MFINLVNDLLLVIVLGIEKVEFVMMNCLLRDLNLGIFMDKILIFVMYCGVLIGIVVIFV